MKFVYLKQIDYIINLANTNIIYKEDPMKDGKNECYIIAIGSWWHTYNTEIERDKYFNKLLQFINSNQKLLNLD